MEVTGYVDPYVDAISKNKMTAGSQVTLKELKLNLKESLRKSGVLDTVKSQIRREFISGLTSKTLSPKKGTATLRDRVTVSAVYHLLKERNYLNSMSVFAAESGIDSKSLLLSEKDIAFAMNLENISEIKNLLKAKENTLKENRTSNAYDGTSYASVFDIVIEHCSGLGRRGRMEVSIQTDSTEQSAENTIDASLSSIQQKLIDKIESEKANREKSIEERMVAFQKQCQEQFDRDLEMRVQFLKEREISKLKHEIERAAHDEFETLQKQLDSDYKRRVQLFSDREEQIKRECADRERKTELQFYEQKQELVKELNDMRSKELAMTRRVELEASGLRMLEQRLQETQSLIEARERDVNRKEADVHSSQKLYKEEAKNEAALLMQKDLEYARSEKERMDREKARMDREIKAHDAVIEAAARKMTAVLHEKLRLNEEEMERLHTEVAEMRRRRQIKEDNLDDVLETSSFQLEGEEDDEEDTKFSRWFQHIIDKTAVGSAKDIGVDALSSMGDQEGWSYELRAEKEKNSLLEKRNAELERLLEEQRGIVQRLSRFSNDTRSKQHDATTDLLDAVLKRKNDLLTNRLLQPAPTREPAPAPLMMPPPPPQFQPMFNYPYPSPYFYHPAQMGPYGSPAPQPTAAAAAESVETPAADSIGEKRAVESMYAELERKKVEKMSQEIEWAREVEEKKQAHAMEEAELTKIRLQNEKIRMENEALQLRQQQAELEMTNAAHEDKHEYNVSHLSPTTKSSSDLVWEKASSPSSASKQAPVSSADLSKPYITVTSPPKVIQVKEKTTPIVDNSEELLRTKAREEEEEARLRKQEEDDAAAVAAARAKVIARRKSKQSKDMSATHLSAAAPIAADKPTLNKSVFNNADSDSESADMQSSDNDRSDFWS